MTSTNQQRRELSGFVNALAEAAGYTTTAEWARDSGYPAPNLSNLRNGRRAVDGYNLFRLIRAAAARTTITPDDLALGLARATAEDGTVESIDRRLEELSELVTRALERLEGAQTAPAAPPKREGSRTDRRKRAAAS